MSIPPPEVSSWTTGIRLIVAHRAVGHCQGTTEGRDAATEGFTFVPAHGRSAVITSPPLLAIAPPLEEVLLEVKLHFVNVRLPWLKIAPPSSIASFPLVNVTLEMVTLVAAAISKIRAAPLLLPLMVIPAAGPTMVTELAINSSAVPDSVIAKPLRFEAISDLIAARSGLGERVAQRVRAAVAAGADRINLGLGAVGQQQKHHRQQKRCNRRKSEA